MLIISKIFWSSKSLLRYSHEHFGFFYSLFSDDVVFGLGWMILILIHITRIKYEHYLIWLRYVCVNALWRNHYELWRSEDVYDQKAKFSIFCDRKIAQYFFAWLMHDVRLPATTFLVFNPHKMKCSIRATLRQILLPIPFLRIVCNRIWSEQTIVSKYNRAFILIIAMKYRSR